MLTWQTLTILPVPKKSEKNPSESHFHGPEPSLYLKDRPRDLDFYVDPTEKGQRRDYL